MEALFTVQEKIHAIWWGFMVLRRSRVADSEFGLSGRAEGQGEK